MAKRNFCDDRKKAATQLRQLAMILHRKFVCSDTAPLSSAADQCAANTSKTSGSWGYDIANLIFTMPAPKGTLPAKVKDFRAELSISVKGDFDAEEDDQFTLLEVNLEKYAQAAGGAQLKSAWHFDRHIIDTKNDDRYITDDIHPLYHFQFGGAKMAKIQDRVGDTLLLEPPRLMHPPMDAILAIDFVLANYAGNIWKKLREDAQYSNLVLPQFKKIWKPYFDAVAGSWGTPPKTNSSFLCPFI